MPSSRSVTALDLLRAARRVIEQPWNWTQRSMARDRFGGSVRTVSPYACRFCAEGGLQRAAQLLDVRNEGVLTEALVALYDALPPDFDTVPFLNDHPSTTHPTVLALYDRAIAAQAAIACPTTSA